MDEKSLTLVLYTPDAHLGNEARKMMREAGYLPIPVDSMEAVKIMAAPMPQARLDTITQAALWAIRQSEHATKKNFGEYLAKMLTESGA